MSYCRPPSSYLKLSNGIRKIKVSEKVIGFMDILPEEFGLDKYIDYNTQFDKAYLEPIKTVLDAVGWNHERVGSLEGFFG